jgi:2-methylcitrate dehydratase PrpD
MGRLAAAAAGSVLTGLDEERCTVALALAATQTSGLTASFGTMLKAFQGGKAAFDAVLAVELAADGMTAGSALFAENGGLARALVQDGSAQIAVPDFTTGWEVLRNSTKAYPCLHGLHPVIDAARELSAQVTGRAIENVRVEVAPGVPRMARYRLPRTADEAKFSIPYVAALGLAGRRATLADFSEEVLNDPRFRDLMRRVEVVAVEGRKMIDAAMAVTLAGGQVLSVDVPVARGHPGRPLSDAEIAEKFESLVMPVLGARTGELWRTLCEFPEKNAVARAVQCVAIGD